MRRVSGALSRPLRPCAAGRGGCRLPVVHGGRLARGRRGHRGADPPQASERGVPDLHQGSHRRHHVGVEHRGRPRAAAVAVLGERQRQPRAELRAGQDGDQPVDELRRLSLALRARAAGGDAAAPVSEHGARRTAGLRDGRARWIRRIGRGSSPPGRSFSGTGITRICTSARRARRASCCSPAATRPPIAGSSGCSASSTSPSPCPRICGGSTTRRGRSISSSRRAARPRSSIGTCAAEDGFSSPARRPPLCRSAASSAAGPRRRATGACTTTRCFPR